MRREPTLADSYVSVSLINMWFLLIWSSSMVFISRDSGVLFGIRSIPGSCLDLLCVVNGLVDSVLLRVVPFVLLLLLVVVCFLDPVLLLFVVCLLDPELVCCFILFR